MKTLVFSSLFALTLACHSGFSSGSSLTGTFLSSGCTVISLSKGDCVFFGGNDDYINPDSWYWVEPGDSSRLGVIWIGKPDNPQQGVNEKGLAYDANGLPRFDINPHPERMAVGTEYHLYCMQIMHECAKVEEVVRWAETHQHFPYMHDQLHFADATGDAVIISAGKNGEMVFTRKPPGDGFLVSTNFNVANPANGYGYPCWRYDKARDMLNQMVEGEGIITLKDATDVLDGVHVEKGSGWTIETMVADLVKGVIYIYYFFQYDRPVIIDIQNELANPRPPGPLSKLFPEEVQQEGAKRFHAAQFSIRFNKILGIVWPSIVLLCLIILLIFKPADRNRLRFWVPAVVILGPLALIIRLIKADRQKQSFCRNALVETTGDLIPLVFSYTVAVGILVTLANMGKASPLIQVVLMLALPLIAVWLFHAVMLSRLSNRNSGNFAIKRIPQVLVTTFLGLGGMTSVALPLINKNLVMSMILPLSPLAVMAWWAMVVIGGLPAGLLIFLYENRAVRKGFNAWTVFENREGEVTTPGWVKIWWWILISMIIFLAGMTTGVMLAK